MVTKEEKEARIAKEKNWYRDKYQTILVQRNIFAIVTLVSLFTSLVAVFAVQRLAPLKSVEPFVIQVDEKSGMTEVVDPATRTTKLAEEALDNFFVWEYVKARETYDLIDNNNIRDIVRVMSTPDVFTEYRKFVSAQNPLSPAAKLGSDGVRHVDNATITYLKEVNQLKKDKKVAQVRFQMTETYKGIPTIMSKIATVEYDYFLLELTRNERLMNPLGFQVVGYRIDEEATQK
jgi:type IV secretion system protein VirB8